jgi:hypothetical protein
MKKVLFSMPDNLANRMTALIPLRQRSKVLARLLEDELKRREADLYRCALEVEGDHALNAEMEVWHTTIGDGIYAESW